MPYPAIAFIDPTGPMQVLYLTKILFENIKRFQQLSSMISQAKNADQYLRTIHAGLENLTRLATILPVKDEKILAQLTSFQKSFNTLEKIYGKVPKSKEAAMQMLHDQSIAESIRMVNSFKDYSRKQEEHSVQIAIQSRSASPKGAARMQAETSAQILRSLSQLIRLNSQMLKLQSEQLAMNNKMGKASVASYQKVHSNFRKGFRDSDLDMKLPTF